MATTYMTLTLPTPTVTAGPEWANELNTALTAIDAHDHSTGKGTKVTPNGLNINADLSIGTTNNLTLVRSMRLVSQGAALALPTDLGCIYSVGGDLYWNNSSGTQVRLTNGGSPTTATDGISRSFEKRSISSNTTINAADTHSFYEIDCGTSVTMTLPAASGVAAGRFYLFKDVTGEASSNNLTLGRNGSDKINEVAADVVIDYDFGCIMAVSNGVDNWQLIMLPGTAQIVTGQLSDSSVSTAKIIDEAVTLAKLADHNYVQSSSTGSSLYNQTTYTQITNMNVSLTVSGRRMVDIKFIHDGSANQGYISGATSSTTSPGLQIRIKEGSTVIYETRIRTSNSNPGTSDSFIVPPGVISHSYIPSSSGAKTYTAEYKHDASSFGDFAHMKLHVEER